MEMVVTVSLGSMLAAAAIPNLGGAMSAHRLMSGLRETVSVIRQARSVAVSRNQLARVSVSGGNTLTIEASSDGGTTWASVGEPQVLESGVTVSSVSPANGLRFTGTGTVASAVAVTVRNAKGDTKQINVALLGGVDLS